MPHLFTFIDLTDLQLSPLPAGRLDQRRPGQLQRRERRRRAQELQPRPSPQPELVLPGRLLQEPVDRPQPSPASQGPTPARLGHLCPISGLGHRPPCHRLRAIVAVRECPHHTSLGRRHQRSRHRPSSAASGRLAEAPSCAASSS